MPFASMGRRRWLAALASAGATLALPRAMANPAAVTPIRQLCDGLLGIMKAGHATPFQQRYEALAPVAERTFDLLAILQLSVGPSWARPADRVPPLHDRQVCQQLRQLHRPALRHSAGHQAAAERRAIGADEDRPHVGRIART
jgi:hypothetical protein